MPASMPERIYVRERPRSNSFAIACLVLGVLSLFTLCLPGLGMLVSGLGLLLALCGVLVALCRGGAGLGYVVAGGLLSLAAFGLNSLITHVFLEVQQKPPLSASPKAKSRLGGTTD